MQSTQKIARFKIILLLDLHFLAQRTNVEKTRKKSFYFI